MRNVMTNQRQIQKNNHKDKRQRQIQRPEERQREANIQGGVQLGG